MNGIHSYGSNALDEVERTLCVFTESGATMSGAGDLAPGNVWSFAEIMRSIFASGLFSIVAGIVAFEHLPNDFEIGEEAKDDLAEKFKSYESDLKDLGLVATNASLQRLVQKVQEPGSKWSDLVGVCVEFRGRLLDETNEKLFFSLTPLEGEYFEKPRLGWERAIERFPTIVDDVEEARKCFALSRYPASVFHSVQIVETGLIELGKFLKVSDPLSGWTAVSNALTKVIDKKYQERTAFEKKNFQFLEQTQGTVAGLKNAWRNKISHVNGKLVVMTKEFSPEVAEEILMATRAFMRRLAEGLPEPKKLKAALS
ncbi:hypothetical protein V1291_004821 [Nitrobacteraceae bacterium AZCC 1564]